jgi:hypothetical protein
VMTAAFRLKATSYDGSKHIRRASGYILGARKQTGTHPSD